MSNILYIDDSIDPVLDKYLGELAEEIEGASFSDMEFDPTEGIPKLINEEKVRKANIIVIDSRLFENRNAEEKYSGEEVSVCLRRVFPFLEVIVVSQNALDERIDYVTKISGRTVEEAYMRYNEKLRSKIIDADNRVKQYQMLYEKINGNSNWEASVKEDIKRMMDGDFEYNNLSKTDIDSLIEAFKRVEESINERL